MPFGIGFSIIFFFSVFDKFSPFMGIWIGMLASTIFVIAVRHDIAISYSQGERWFGIFKNIRRRASLKQIEITLTKNGPFNIEHNGIRPWKDGLTFIASRFRFVGLEGSLIINLSECESKFKDGTEIKEFLNNTNRVTIQFSEE
jgi:hypothetical protein